MSAQQISMPSASTLAPATVRSVERNILAVTAVVLLHFVLLAGALVTYVIAANCGLSVALPKQPPLLIWTVALVLAHSSSIAIWWARFKWPYHLKTFMAVLACGCLWALLTATLSVCHYHPISAASWAAGIGTQLVLTGIASLVLESIVYRPSMNARPQFSIMYLMLWTAVVAALCGAGRWLSESWGWTAAEVFGWEYTRHLQILGIADALLAIGVLVSVRLKSSWRSRSVACALTICLVCLLGSIALFESQRGPTIADLVWLLGNQGLFLAATLIPLKIAREKNARDTLQLWLPTIHISK